MQIPARGESRQICNEEAANLRYEIGHLRETLPATTERGQLGKARHRAKMNRIADLRLLREATVGDIPTLTRGTFFSFFSLGKETKPRANLAIRLFCSQEARFLTRSLFPGRRMILVPTRGQNEQMCKGALVWGVRQMQCVSFQSRGRSVRNLCASRIHSTRCLLFL